MVWYSGNLLVASPILFDPNFARSVIFIIQHDEDGALGVALDRPTDEKVTDHLPTLAGHLAGPDAVFVGGPVEPEVAIGLVRSDAPAVPVPLEGVGILDVTGGTPEGPCRVFSGYSGWGAGQLEAELEEGAWVVLGAESEDLFTPHPTDLWSRVLRRQGGRLALLASHPGDATLN